MIPGSYPENRRILQCEQCSPAILDVETDRELGPVKK